MSTSSSSEPSASAMQKLQNDIDAYKTRHPNWEDVEFKLNYVTALVNNLTALIAQGKFHLSIIYYF